jgi:hypothetical protein
MTEEYEREVRHYAFGPLITVQQLPKGHVKTIRRMAERAKRAKRDHRKYLAGMLASEWSFSQDDDRAAAALLGAHIEEYVKQGMAYTQGDYTELLEDGVPILQGTWVNYMKPGEFNPPHTHGALISMIIYLDVPEAIHAEMKTTVGNSHPGAISFRWGESQPLSINLAAAAPKTGEMYIFPAHIEHQVNPFYSDGTRISVSGNWQIGPKV